MHTQLMNKLKLRGMNALFGLRIQITVGENMLMGLAVSMVLIFGLFCFLKVFFQHKKTYRCCGIQSNITL